VKAFLRSGELAELTGVSTDTLRHYERIGVLQPPRRSPSNYRLYPSESVDRVRLIQHALSVGFSLDELKKILRVRDQGGAPCRHVKALLEEKLASLDREIEGQIALRDHLRLLLKDWQRRLQETPDGQPARLLETLSTRKGMDDENSRTRFNRRRSAGRARRS
jgi:DNA-binding transcriptional MerR regulator